MFRISGGSDPEEVFKSDGPVTALETRNDVEYVKSGI